MTHAIINPILVVVLLINFFLLGTGRLKAIIGAVAIQGVILGVVYAVAHPETHDGGASAINLRTLILAAVIIGIKGYVMPRIMMFAMREARVEWTSEPYVTGSLLVGAAGTGLVMALAKTLPLRPEDASHFLVSTSFTTVLTGLLILTMRREALTQVSGYLVMENGIFIFGLLLVQAMPALVEIGILLDLFVGVFVMGIIIHHIHREFSASTSDHLSALKE